MAEIASILSWRTFGCLSVCTTLLRKAFELFMLIELLCVFRGTGHNFGPVDLKFGGQTESTRLLRLRDLL